MPPKTGQRYDSPFTPEQETWIILEFSALRNCLTLDYWFWNMAMAELRRAPPRNIGELKTTVNAFAESLDYADVEKCVRHIRDRARACISKIGGQFEGGLNRLRMNWDGDK